MNNKEFDQVLEKRIEAIRQTLQKKASEYAAGDDRLHNFKRAAAIIGDTVEKAIIGMAVKHVVSVLDIVDNWNNKPVSDEMLDEKIGDTINYLILLEAHLKECNYITTHINNLTHHQV